MKSANTQPTTDERQSVPLWLSVLKLVGFITIAFFAALPAAWIGTGAWYAELRKPSWAPPGWIFGPVWTILYIMMGVAAWGVWRRVGWSTPIALWFLQLAMNCAWTPIFFGLRQPGWAFAEIVVLWVAILATTRSFSKSVPWTGFLMMPYLAWVSFAAVLNFSIWRANA
jgi:tryptophan-rich sensory protein